MHDEVMNMLMAINRIESTNLATYDIPVMSILFQAIPYG